MSEQTNPFRDSTLNLDQAYYYTLLLLIDNDTFSYAVAFRNKLLAYNANCALSELAEPAAMQEILSAPYKKVVIGFTANGFTLVPHHVFNADHVASFARLLDVKPTEKVLAQVLDDQNYIIYKVDDHSLNAIEKFNFKDIAFAGKGLIKLIAQNSPTADNVYLNIIDNKVEFIYFEHNMLRFYNKFEFKSPEDLVYYTALVTQELKLQPPFTVMLSGDVVASDTLHTHLSAYFENVAINQIKLMQLPDQLLSHQLLSLSALSLCESSEGL